MMKCPSCKEYELEAIGYGPSDPDEIVRCELCKSDWNGWSEEVKEAWEK